MDREKGRKGERGKGRKKFCARISPSPFLPFSPSSPSSGLYTPGSDPGSGPGRGGLGPSGHGHPRPPGGGRKESRPGRGGPTRAGLAATCCRRSPQCGPLPAATVVFRVFFRRFGAGRRRGRFRHGHLLRHLRFQQYDAAFRRDLRHGPGDPDRDGAAAAGNPRVAASGCQRPQPARPAQRYSRRILQPRGPDHCRHVATKSLVGGGHRPLSPRAGSGRVFLRLAKWPERRFRSGKGTACPGGGRFPAHLLRRHRRHDEQWYDIRRHIAKQYNKQ